jgi:two-component sensor histidine kinase
MSRLGELDLPDRLSPAVPRVATMVVVGLLCSALLIMTRALLEAAVGTSGAPFAFIFPATILATLFARWQAGAIAGLTSTLYAWYFVYPVRNSFRVDSLESAYAVVFIIIGAILTVAICEAFRRAAHLARIERDREIADRDLLLDEFDHRMKNNFQIVASILDIQRRRTSGDAAEALGVALHRVESIGRAHRHLYRGAHDTGAVQIRAYLGDLCDALADALLLRGGVALTCSSDDARVPRDRAVSIGLVLNELVTNAAKHAFEGSDGGTIAVSFREAPGGWALIVADDGRGMERSETAPKSPDSGLGSRLIPAFARQAGGTVRTETGPDGTTVTLELPRSY